MACVDDQNLEALAAGVLPSEVEVATRAHLASCDACGERFEHLATRADPLDTDDETVVDRANERRIAPRHEHEPIARGTSLGRYLIVEKLARGGMGVVYTAYDPELHRRVAIKLLLPQSVQTKSSTAGRTRLLREAQAMARLSHPNVIHVYDVGTYRDAVFLALEFIDGENLSKWIRREKPSWREALRVVLAAGRGLAAAHAAGLVHRDFKPDNVLIGKDGRVLVTDFGLAREAGDEAPDHAISDAPVARGSQPSISSAEEPPSSRGQSRQGLQPAIPNTPLSMPLTKIGTIMGTPGYAAPEHLAGGLADARSDQFSFAASLYAALYHKRPYAAKTFSEYRQLLAAGLPEPPANLGVPSWVRRTVERGLAIDPAARFPSLDALLDELSRDPAARRRRVWFGVGAVGVVAAAIGTTIVASSGRDDAATCTGAEAKLAGVWDDARREQVRATFLVTKRAFAEGAFDAVAKRLDERARAWVAMRVETCEATQRRREQPESVMVVRMACLDQRLREMGQLVDVFATGDGTVVERAVQATSSMSSLEDCADVTRLLAAVEPPKDAATRAKVEDIRTALGRAKALTDAGQYKTGHAIATRATADARKLAYRPILAEALVQLGELQSYLGDRETSAMTLRESIRIADACRDDAVRARAFTWLVGVVGYDLARPADGLALAADAQATIDRLGGDPRLEATLESNLGRIYSVTADFTQMYDHHHKALEIRRRIYGDEDPNTANAQNNVAAALNELGRITEALAGHRKALAMREKALGREHPSVAMSLANIGSQLYDLGDLDEGLRVTDQALAIARRSLPTRSSLILIALGNRASMLGELARFEEAQATFDELLTTVRAEQPKSPRMIRGLASYSMALLTPSGRAVEGLAAAEQALTLGTDAKSAERALALVAKGLALEALGRGDESVAAHRAAIEIYEQIVGHDKSAILDSLTSIGRVELARGHATEAARSLARGLAICEQSSLTGKWLARTQFQLARAVVATDRARAVELATRARVWYAASPLTRELAEIDTWLATHE